MLSHNDIRNLLAFLNRVTVNGAEAPVLVGLQQKLSEALTSEVAPAAPRPEDNQKRAEKDAK
jgi:hypothetical protein